MQNLLLKISFDKVETMQGYTVRYLRYFRQLVPISLKNCADAMRCMFNLGVKGSFVFHIDENLDEVEAKRLVTELGLAVPGLECYIITDVMDVLFSKFIPTYSISQITADLCSLMRWALYNQDFEDAKSINKTIRYSKKWGLYHVR